MTRIYSNPLNLSYRYQHVQTDQGMSIYREGADPTLILFNGRYYLFVSMSAGFWWSEDLLTWHYHENQDLLIHDYAPDVRQIGDYLYFSASRRQENCPILRSREPLADDFEEVSAPFPFWDPHLFGDEDGRVYFYWGCSNREPLYGVEMDPETMTPLTEPIALFIAQPEIHGFERLGENGVSVPRMGLITPGLSSAPYTEGPFMNKVNGRYYLQYAVPGTEYNTYADGVYVGEQPLGPFEFTNHNPFSSKPGGFIAAAGHGSTIQDKYGNWWHAATMRISVNHIFERRVGLFPAGFDEDGVLFCNQNLADYPIAIPEGKFDPWQITPRWMLLSYGKDVRASSSLSEHEPALAVDEDIRSWWSAATPAAGEWLEINLGERYAVHAIQVNLADEDLTMPEMAAYEMGGPPFMRRHIDTSPLVSRYLLEGSLDGADWFVLADKRTAETDLPHDLFLFDEGREARFIRLTGHQLPYDQPLRVSGLRVFGRGNGRQPAATQARAERTDALNGLVQWQAVPGAQGYNVRYGIHPDKLYLSWQVHGQTSLNLSTLNKGATYYVAVDSFNENGITPGQTIEMG